MRNHALDGLRACAATLIVVFHLGVTALVALALGGGPRATALLHDIGTSGVDLFFTLSAVVLLRPYLDKTRRMDIGRYFWRRAKRLWPPFLGAWVLAGATVAVIAAHPTWWPSAMPAFDWQTWGAQSLIVYFGHGPYNFAWWTLTIEVMFYVIAPLLVLWFAGRSRPSMMVAVFASMVIAQVAMLLPVTSNTGQWIVKLISFASCFMGGVFLAMHPLQNRLGAALLVVGSAVVIASSMVDPRIDSHVGFGLVYMAIVARALDATSRISRLLSAPWLVWLGERSYSLFLTHYSVIALACWSTSLWIPGKGPTYFVVSRTLALVGALLVACLVFECVERRFANGLVTAGQWVPWRRQRTTPATATD